MKNVCEKFMHKKVVKGSQLDNIYLNISKTNLFIFLKYSSQNTLID